MYCDQCGARVEANQAFCSACGKRVGKSLVPAVHSRIAGHVRLLAILWFALSGLLLIPALFLIWWSRTIGNFIPSEVIGMVLLAFALGGFLTGWGLMERAPWARTLTIVLGFVSLLHFPLGTALGIYTLWVLLPAQSALEYYGAPDEIAPAR